MVVEILQNGLDTLRSGANGGVYMPYTPKVRKDLAKKRPLQLDNVPLNTQELFFSTAFDEVIR